MSCFCCFFQGQGLVEVKGLNTPILIRQTSNLPLCHRFFHLKIWLKKKSLSIDTYFSESRLYPDAVSTQQQFCAAAVTWLGFGHIHVREKSLQTTPRFTALCYISQCQRLVSLADTQILLPSTVGHTSRPDTYIQTGATVTWVVTISIFWLTTIVCENFVILQLWRLLTYCNKTKTFWAFLLKFFIYSLAF